MAIKVSREQRDAIYAEVMLDLSGTGDIQIELDNGDYDAARRHRRRFEDDMRLLDDIGWEPEADGEEFELSMPADQLARTLRHLNAKRAGDAAGAYRRADRSAAARAAVACRADGLRRRARPAVGGELRQGGPLT